jgi:hypothetical protein
MTVNKTESCHYSQCLYIDCFIYCYAVNHYPECRYAESRYAECYVNHNSPVFSWIIIRKNIENIFTA